MEVLGIFFFMLLFGVAFCIIGVKTTIKRNEYLEIKKKCVKPVPFKIDNFSTKRKFSSGTDKKLRYEHTFEYSFETNRGWQSDKLVFITTSNRKISVEDFKVLCSTDYEHHVTEPYGDREYPSGIIFIVFGIIFTLCAITILI